MAISTYTNRDCQIIQLERCDTLKLGNNVLLVADETKYLLVVGYRVSITTEEHKDIIQINKIDKDSETATYAIESKPDPEVWATLIDQHLSFTNRESYYTYRSDIADRIYGTYARSEYPTARGFAIGLILGIILSISMMHWVS